MSHKIEGLTFECATVGSILTEVEGLFRMADRSRCLEWCVRRCQHVIERFLCRKIFRFTKFPGVGKWHPDKTDFKTDGFVLWLAPPSKLSWALVCVCVSFQVCQKISHFKWVYCEFFQNIASKIVLSLKLWSSLAWRQLWARQHVPFWRLSVKSSTPSS